MAKQVIGVGGSGNDGTGDPLRTAFQKAMGNFDELYAAIATLGTAATKNAGAAAGNVPVLDSGGLLDPAVLPLLAITDTFVVASQAAMLALTAQRGDVAIRTDLSKSYVLSTNSPGTLADWKELLSPTGAVLSVAGLTGAIAASALKAALAIASADITDASANGRSLIAAANYAAMRTLLNVPATCKPQGRLTLASGAPVMTLSQSAKTTLYYSPYTGDQIPLYDGTNMVPTTFSELSVATTDTAKNPAAIGTSKVNDWFVWNDGGTLRLSHGPDYTNDTTRSAGTALVMVKGVLLNNAAIANGPAAQRGTYIGTTRSDASSQLNFVFGTSASGGGAALLNVWNAYNRVEVGTIVTDTGSFTNSSGSIAQFHSSAGNQVSFVVGLQEDAALGFFATETALVAASGAVARVGLGFDTTTAFSAPRAIARNDAAAVRVMGLLAIGQWSVPIGAHVMSANQSGDSGNANEFNNAGSATLSFKFKM